MCVCVFTSLHLTDPLLLCVVLPHLDSTFKYINVWFKYKSTLLLQCPVNGNKLQTLEAQNWKKLHSYSHNVWKQLLFLPLPLKCSDSSSGSGAVTGFLGPCWGHRTVLH